MKRKLRQILVFLLSARVNGEREAGKVLSLSLCSTISDNTLPAPFFPLSPFVLFVSCTLHKISTKINGFQQFSLNVKHITTEISKASLQNTQRNEDKMYSCVLYGTEGLAFNNKYQTAQQCTWQHSEDSQDTELRIKRYNKGISAELRLTDVTSSVMKGKWHSDKRRSGFVMFCFYTYKRRVKKCK